MKKTTLGLLALTLTLTLGLTTNAFAWHGGGHGGYSGCSGGGGWHGNEHRGYALNRHASSPMYDDEREYAGGRGVNRQNPYNGANFDYTAPHKVTPNCEGMTGPHGRHITDK